VGLAIDVPGSIRSGRVIDVLAKRQHHNAVGPHFESRLFDTNEFSAKQVTITPRAEMLSCRI
jgi:hypothetical protein